MATKKVKRKIQPPERPALRRHQWRDGGWLILEPAGLAMIGGVFCAGVSLVFFLVRQWMGAEVPIMDVVFGLLKTFVVSYAGVGAFVLYLLWVAENEFDKDKKKKEERRGLKGEERQEEAMPVAPGDAPPPESGVQSILEGPSLVPQNETEEKES